VLSGALLVVLAGMSLARSGSVTRFGSAAASRATPGPVTPSSMLFARGGSVPHLLAAPADRGERSLVLTPAAEEAGPNPWPLALDPARPTSYVMPTEFNLYPPWHWVGWVASNEPEENHFGDSSLYVGFYNHVVYYSLARFGLREIAGAPIYSATLRLNGLSEERLGEEGTWTVQLLAPDPGDVMAKVDTFSEIEKATASPAISFTLQSGDLGAGQVNAFTFTEEQLALLEERALQTGKITFRLAGPTEGKNALFVWDSGYGLASRGLLPELIVQAGPVTTPPDVAQFVKQSVPAEMVAGQSYDVTITMKNSGSNTWGPQGTFGYALGSQNPWDNKAWGENRAALPGEVPPGQQVDIAFSVKAPAKPGSYNFQWQMIHKNVEWFGDRTENVEVQVVAPPPAATPTPKPTQTPTPTPTNTPLSIPFPNPTMTPVPTATPTPDPAKIPSKWKGRIAFISDRDGGKAAYYIMDADGKNVEKLTSDYFYRSAAVRDTLSPDNQYQLIVAKYKEDTQINLLRLSDGVQKYLVGGEKGTDHAPAYCQAEPRYFAWTSSQLGLIEIFVADLLDGGSPGQIRTTRMTQDTNGWEWDKHPSWSPDCKQIVFYSNRTGKDQIWVMDFWGMNFDGANQHPISDGNYNDWDPVWIK
jgi:hypothetical protein